MTKGETFGAADVLNEFLIVEVQAVDAGTFFLATSATVKSSEVSTPFELEVDEDDDDETLSKFFGVELFDTDVWELI